MVGLKSVWLLLFSLLLFGACVPQKKQTECGSNEAFNSQLRSCVPIVQGPTAFINISSYSPLYTATRYKNDTTPVTFTIAVSNPYNQTYSIEWDMNYNGIINTIAGNVTTTSIIPALYSTQIGSNVITAKIISGGQVVDSHNFEVMIQDSPRPNINTTTIFPADYYPTLYPDNTGQRFSFTGRNNGATGIGNYRVFWTLSQNGVNLPAYAETDTFTNTASNGTNVFYYGDSTTPTFDPSTLGPASYVLRVRMEDTNDGTVVAENQWNITVRDPDFGFVSSAGSPLPSQDTVAFFAIDYATYPFANIAATSSSFCVTVSDPDGSYTNGSASDPTNLDVVVRFYKDGSGTPLFEGRTDGSAAPIVDTVCFDDATAAEQATLVFNDGSPTTPHYRSLKARVFDEQTGREICGTGMTTCPVTYPIVWNILVKPLDTGVTAAFNSAIATDNITYTTSGSSTRSATVTQNDSVTIRFVPTDGIVGYEGYDMTDNLNASHFSYDIVLKQSGTTVATIPCKTTADNFPFTSNPQQSCTFDWPAYNTTTNEHLDPGAYVAYLQVTDDGSPVPGSVGTVSNALTINATVTEPTNAPRLNPAPDIRDVTNAGTIISANEGETIRFRARIEEDEHDDYVLSVGYCGTDATCASPTAAGTDSRSYNDAPLYAENTFITYMIPDDALGSTLSATVYFKVTVTDAPSDITKSSSNSTIISLTVNNANASPGFTAANVTPASPGTYDVFAGQQFTGKLNNAISDASTDADERPNMYQWWISTTNDINDPTVWTAIEGATSDILRWTPGSELTTTAYIAVCYSDGYPRVDADSVNAPDVDGNAPDQLCSVVWTIEPKTNSQQLTNLPAATGEVAIHHVPAENIAYVAYASDNVITVEKVEYSASGLGKPMDSVTFNSLPGLSTADSIKDLSITASDESLYVAYLADDSGAPGFGFTGHIRRINISNANLNGGSKTATVFSNSTGMQRKFGFDYLGISVSPSCGGGSNCALVGNVVTFDGTALTAGTHEITVNGVSITTAVDGVYTSTQLCSNCNASEQADSFASAINANPATGLQGVTAFASGSSVTIYGMEVDGTESYDGTDVLTAAGKILFNDDNDMWYWPVANSVYPAGANKIQFLRGPENSVASGSVLNNVELSLDTVSAIDNAWSTDAPLQMYVGYVTLVGSRAKVSKFTMNGSDEFINTTTKQIFSTGVGYDNIQLSPPLGAENPYVYVSGLDTAGSIWVSRLPADLSTHSSYKVESYGADATDTTILSAPNVSAAYVVPAKADTVGGTTTEARLVVVSNKGTATYQSYLFRWKTDSGGLPVFDSTTTFDIDEVGKDTSGTSQLAASAPTSMTIGEASADTSGNTNNTMPVVRVRTDGEVEINFLNTEVESINSSTDDAAGLFHAPFIK